MPVSMAVLHADLALPRTGTQTQADAPWVVERTAQLPAGGVQWRPGARELLGAVRAAYLRTALVTTPEVVRRSCSTRSAAPSATTRST